MLSHHLLKAMELVGTPYGKVGKCGESWKHQVQRKHSTGKYPSTKPSHTRKLLRHQSRGRPQSVDFQYKAPDESTRAHFFNRGVSELKRSPCIENDTHHTQLTQCTETNIPYAKDMIQKLSTPRLRKLFSIEVAGVQRNVALELACNNIAFRVQAKPCKQRR